MHEDISELLNTWPHTPGQLNVRLIEGQDGEPRIQIRLDLGILQLHMRGRPDGQRPNGYLSYLDYYEARIDGLEGFDDEEEPSFGSGTNARPVLSEEDCRLLREEAAQYYHRYMALLVLEDFEGVVRDTTRNLRVLDLCSAHAQNEGDRQVLEPYRPYIMMIRARAMAGQALKENEPKAALLAIDEGLDALKGYFEDAGQPEAFRESSEVQMLESMRKALVPKLPVSQKSELRQRLQAAIEQENYELAAILRDELRMLKDEPSEHA